MATATLDSPITTAGDTATVIATAEPPLQLDALPTVDLGLLSQSELYSLSLCSPSTFDPLRCDDVVIPKIDRSVFNESAGSRKQTYSRLRLASSSAAESAAFPPSLRRRTPHLRHASNLPYQYLDSDPEKAENHQILALLKQLFGLDSSSICVNDDRNEELVPIRVDYSHLVPQLLSQSANDLHFVSQSGNAGLTGQKRKRGRPRKNENAVGLVENEVVQSHFDNGISVIDSPMNNAIVLYENVEDRDKEIVNRDGVEVDLVAIGAMEDPYGQELRRRTEGMGTEEELLEFLRGLNGQWGSRRKKKRIVDASEFGNALPRGWALLLSIKKKEGRVWLFCRRYISPDGRPFLSCKEISSYLLSLHGVQGANQLICAQSKADSETANSTPSVSTVGQAVVDEKMEMNPLCQISSAIASTSGNFEVEVTLKTGELPAVQVGEVLQCEKCNLTFKGKDDFLQHQISSHRRRRSKNGESVTDGVIIKDGKFECQICHKAFIERHRYNGHMGAHVRNQVKCSDETQATDLKESIGTGSFDLIPAGSTVKTSIGPECNIATEILTSSAVDVRNSYSPHSNNKQNGDLKESNTMVGEVDEVMYVNGLKTGLCLHSEAVLYNSSNDNSCGASGGATVVATGIEAGLNKARDLQGVGSQGCKPVLSAQTPGSSENNIIGLSVNLKEPESNAAPGSDLHGSNENDGLCGIGLDDGDLSQTVIERRIEDKKFVANDSIPDFDKKHDGLDVSSGIGDQQHQESEEHLLRNVDNADGKSVSTVSGFDQDIVSNYSVLAPHGDKEKCTYNVLNHILLSTGSRVVRQEHNKIYAFVSESASTSELNKDSATSLRDIGNCTVLPSWNEEVNYTEKHTNEVSTCFIDSHGQPKESENSLGSLSSFQVNCGVQQYVDGVSARQMEESKVDDVPNVRNNEFIPFSNSSKLINTDAITSNKHERRPEFRSFFPSENAGDYIATVHNNLVKESRKQLPESVLLAQSCTAEASHEGYNMNEIFSTQLDERKINDTGNSKNHDLSLASDSQANNSVQLERYPAGKFDVQSSIRQMFGVQNNLNNVAHIGLENPKEVRPFGFDTHNSALGDGTCDFDNNFNMIYQGKVWEAPKIHEIGNSSNKFMVDFDGRNPQPVEDVMSGSIWRTGEENLLQTGLASTSIPLVQSSNSFRTFDIISEKGEGLFGVDQKYEGGTGFEGLRLGRSEPVEYSFMTTHTSNSIPGESKGFSYEVNTGQGFDSSFWLGKDALMPNVTSQNQVPTLCVWCRNEFYQEPITSGAQTGAIGSMCPACSSKISQFNVL